jgi:YVTN family beta-propeller protein
MHRSSLRRCAFTAAILLTITVVPGSASAATPPATVSATIAIPGGGATVAAGSGSLWVAGRNDATVVRVDPSSGTVTGIVQLPAPTFLVAVGEGSVWATDPEHDVVRRIDPATLQIVATIVVGDLPDWITTGFGSVWVSNHHDNTVSRIDPATDTVIAVIPVGGSGMVVGGPSAITAGGGSIWVGLPRAHQVARIDPWTNAVAETAGGIETCAQMAVSAGFVWVAGGFCDRPKRGLGRVSIETSQLRTLDLFPNPILGVAPAPGGVWYATFGEIGRVDASRNEVVGRMPYDGFVSPLVSAFDSVWFMDDLNAVVVRLDPSS